MFSFLSNTLGSLLSTALDSTLPPAPSPARAARPSRQLPAYRPSALDYFRPAPAPALTHAHPRPSLADVCVVSALLSHKLPVELVPAILDYAGYTAACRTTNRRRLDVGATTGITAHGRRGVDWVSGQEDELAEWIGEEADSALRDGPGEVWYLVSAPVGCAGATTDDGRAESDAGERVWVRSVTVDLLSKDQGWSSVQREHYGTYNHSYSWFECSLLRAGREVPGSRCTVQHNVHAGQALKDHRVVLDRSHALVAAMVPGDRVVLWARAKYPGWRNLVARAAITIETSPYP
ncbi:hypothetical protein Q5752_006155 [Cryptotrichosporon argae]